MTTEPNQKPEDLNNSPEGVDENLSSLNEAASAQTDGSAGADSEAPAAAEGTPDFYKAAIKALQDEADAAKDKMMRALADAENTRRRALKERDDAGKYAVSAFARDLLDFSDNFYRALESIPEDLRGDERVAPVVTGLQAMNTQLLQSFERHGIRKIDPLDEPFNPNFHEVMFEAPVPGKPGGIVIQVVESGYVLNDRLLRAAKVGVSKGDDGNHQVDQSA